MNLLNLLILLIFCSPNPIVGTKTCYCNHAECARTNYLCKSKLDTCYSQLVIGNYEPVRHGCVDSLASNPDTLCTGAQTSVTRLQCCSENMCNYQVGELMRAANEDQRPNGLNVNIRNFDVLVILITMLGACILATLFFLALRMLRKDNKSTSLLVKHGCSDYQVPVLVHDLDLQIHSFPPSSGDEVGVNSSSSIHVDTRPTCSLLNVADEDTPQCASTSHSQPARTVRCYTDGRLRWDFYFTDRKPN